MFECLYYKHFMLPRRHPSGFCMLVTHIALKIMCEKNRDTKIFQ